jgi:hypothetical protein
MIAVSSTDVARDTATRLSAVVGDTETASLVGAVFVIPRVSGTKGSATLIS